MIGKTMVVSMPRMAPPSARTVLRFGKMNDVTMITRTTATLKKTYNADYLKV